MKNKRISQFLFEIGTLRKVIRSHRQVLLTDDTSDNIASHSYRVAMIGYLLSKLEKADSYKVLVMCLFHDAGESRSGDQNWLNKSYVKVFEDEVMNTQIKDLTEDNEAFNFANEYRARESIESKIVKDADLIDQILLLKEYAHNGNKEAQSWLDKNIHKDLLFTKTAKDLAEEIYEQSPNSWWWELWTEKRR